MSRENPESYAEYQQWKGAPPEFMQGGQLRPNKLTGEIAAERLRQIDVEGYTPEHDDALSEGELAKAAACYAYHAGASEGFRSQLAELSAKPLLWPWSIDAWKPTDRRTDLIKAGALIVAAIERMDRAGVDCPHCHGRGTEDGFHPCQTCNGDGRNLPNPPHLDRGTADT